MENNTAYAKNYSESGLWEKFKKCYKNIGMGAVENALKLFYAMKLGKANTAQIAAIIGALGYLICPIDAVPDILGPAGFVDDSGVLAAAVAALACCADPEVKAASKAKAREIFD